MYFCYYEKIDNQEATFVKKLDIPKGWAACNILDVSSLLNTTKIQIKTKKILPKGIIPVVSQSQNLIDGYCDNIDLAISDLPVVLFGDHTRTVKYIDFPFVVGADGVKIHKIQLVNSKYVYYWMLYAASNIRNKGYARHYDLLKKEALYLPPLSEQSRIVSQIETILSILKDEA